MMQYRSLLFTPGTQKEKLLKSLNSHADALIWDLEDAVHPDEKIAAQATITEVFEELEGKPIAKPIFLRVNAFETPWYEEDVKLARCEGVAGILLPKTESKQQVGKSWELMGNRGAIITLIETACGILHLEEIAKAPAITGIALGAIDLAVDLDLTLTDSGWELAFARSKIVTVAKAFGIRGIYDSVFADIENESSLRKRASVARQFGFNGQMAIHPKQLSVIHEVYSPSEADIVWAKRVLDAVDQEAKGQGVFTLDGKMVDRPVIERAKQIYAAAQRM